MCYFNGYYSEGCFAAIGYINRREKNLQKGRFLPPLSLSPSDERTGEKKTVLKIDASKKETYRGRVENVTCCFCRIFDHFFTLRKCRIG